MYHVSGLDSSRGLHRKCSSTRVQLSNVVYCWYWPVHAVFGRNDESAMEGVSVGSSMNLERHSPWQASQGLILIQLFCLVWGTFLNLALTLELLNQSCLARFKQAQWTLLPFPSNLHPSLCLHSCSHPFLWQLVLLMPTLMMAILGVHSILLLRPTACKME
jgi:hypothetical protein